MDSTRIVRVNLDLAKQNYNAIILKQNDTTRIDFTIYNNNVLTNLSDNNFNLIFTKPDNTIVLQNYDFSTNSTIVGKLGVILDVDCLRVAGSGKFEIEILKGTDRLSSFVIPCIIKETSLEGIPSSGKLSFLEEVEALKDELDQSVLDAQDDIAIIESTGNYFKTLYTSDWTLNGTTGKYEKLIDDHNLNSKYLIINIIDALGKPIFPEYTILNQSSVLFESDTNEEMNIIMIAKYYKATTTISDDIALEVVEARKTSASLNERLDGVDTQLAEIMINVLTKGVEVNSTEVQQNNINTVLYNYRGHEIFFPDGDYLIDDSIIVYSNTKLRFSKGANLVFKESSLTVAVNQNSYSGKHMIKNHNTDGLENIEIIGLKLYGNGYTQILDAHRGMRLENVKNLILEDIEINEVSGWGIQYVNLDTFRFKNIKVNQCLVSLHGVNGDGISGSGINGLIENVSGYSSDDLVSLHAGEDILSLTAKVENVTVKNIYPQSKEGELCYRAFAVYDNGSSSTKNVIIDGIFGETLFYSRIQNFTRSATNGIINNLKLKNINLKVQNTTSGETTKAILVKNIDIDSLYIEDSNLYDLNGNVDFVPNAIVIENSNIIDLYLNNLKMNKLNSDQAFILDAGNITNLHLNKIIAINNSSNGTGYLYLKNSTSSNNTNIYYNDIGGSIQEIASIQTGSSGTVRMLLANKGTTINKITPINNDFLYIQGVGYGVYNSKLGKVIYLHDFNKTTGSVYISTNETTYNVENPLSFISLGSGVSTATINLTNKVDFNGIEFRISIASATATISFTYDSVAIFGGSTFGKGTYSIMRLNTNWVMCKLSDNIYSTTGV